MAVEHASVLLPPAYLVRIAGYKLAWENVPGGEYFKLRDGYGEPVSVQEDDDLLFLGKNTLCRVGHDMYRFAQWQTGINWSQIWEKLTGENPIVHSISTAQTGQSVDFVELFNPANFKDQASSDFASNRRGHAAPLGLGLSLCLLSLSASVCVSVFVSFCVSLCLSVSLCVSLCLSKEQSGR